MINVRVKKASKAAIEQRARAEQCTVADLHRRLLRFGMESMPEGWGKAP